MSYTRDEIDQLWRESVAREESLIQAYKQTNRIPSRGMISTPEIDAERAEQKRLFGEYCKLRKQP